MEGKAVKPLLIITLVLWSSIAAAQTGPPQIYASDGTYLGNLSSNRFDPNSVSNPYGVYGSPYGNTINNPYSPYGSPFSPLSPNNPYAVGSEPTPSPCQPGRAWGWR
jgi:hypothetical protein